MARPALVATLLAIMPVAPSLAAGPAPTAVLSTYADLAQAMYGDALATARKLDAAVDALVQAPSEATLGAAREAWLAARVPYQQTEVYRFGNPIVDEWEGMVNAWPLDEGLIDYVAVESYGDSSDENAFYAANVIANPQLTIGGKAIDATVIDAALLAALHEVDEVESNVSRGYHAIEFLLWGQDLNGTGPGKGARPASDYAAGRCLHRRQLRPARRLSPGRQRSAGERSRRHGRELAAGRPRPRRADRRRRAEGAGDDADRLRLLVLRRTRRRTHQARPDAARSRGGA